MDLSMDHQSLTLTCPDCDTEFLVLRGSVYDAAEPVGLYLVALHGHSPGGPVAHLAIGLLDPADQAKDPTAIAMDVVSASGDFGFFVVDWRDSPWQTESYLGEQIDRNEAIEHPRREDYLEVAGYVAKTLPAMSEYLFAT